MDDENNYHAQLTEALSTRAESLEGSAIMQLREQIQGFEVGVSSVYTFFLEKGLIQSDPYRKEQSITEIELPSAKPLSESDSIADISLRLSHYVGQWGFLTNMFHIGLTNLSLKKVKLLLELLDYIQWTGFSVNSNHPITQAVAEIVSKVSQMQDPMAGKIMSNSVVHLRDLSKSIRESLKTITVFLRERYKWHLRDDLLSKMKINAAQYHRNPQELIKNIKFEFSHRLAGVTWYKDLIEEILDEDYGDNAPQLREEVIERLKVAQAAPKKAAKTRPDDRVLLMKIIERMGRSGEPVRSALMKMNENSRAIRERKRSVGERLSEIFASLFKKSSNEVIYQIPIKDQNTGAVRYETINFTRFSAAAMKRANLMQELQDPHSGTSKKARSTDAEALQKYIEANLAELKTLHRRLEGLEKYFQSDSVPVKVKKTMKGCTLNIKHLKSSIGDTMRALNEFTLRREEEEQMRKMGITDM